MIEPYGKLPIEDLRRSLLMVVMRFAGQVTLTKTLRWFLLKESARERRRRGRPPEPSIDPKWSPEELQTRIIRTALHLADISDGRRRRSILAALRHYRSRNERRLSKKRGPPRKNRLELVVAIARYRYCGANSLAAIARRLIEDRHFKNSRKAENFAADVLGIPRKNNNENNVGLNSTVFNR